MGKSKAAKMKNVPGIWEKGLSAHLLTYVLCYLSGHLLRKQARNNAVRVFIFAYCYMRYIVHYWLGGQHPRRHANT